MERTRYRFTRLRQINGELAALLQTFGRNLLEETAAFELHVVRRDDLGDLPPSLTAAASLTLGRQDQGIGAGLLAAAPTSSRPLNMIELPRVCWAVG